MCDQKKKKCVFEGAGILFLLEIGYAAHRGHHSAVAFLSRVTCVGSEVAAFSFLLLGSGILSRVQSLWLCQVSVTLAWSGDRQSPGPCSRCPCLLKCSFVTHSGMFPRSSWNSLRWSWKVTYFLREVSLLPSPPTEAATPAYPLTAVLGRPLPGPPSTPPPCPTPTSCSPKGEHGLHDWHQHPDFWPNFLLLLGSNRMMSEEPSNGRRQCSLLLKCRLFSKWWKVSFHFAESSVCYFRSSSAFMSCPLLHLLFQRADILAI